MILLGILTFGLTIRSARSAFYMDQIPQQLRCIYPN